VQHIQVILSTESGRPLNAHLSNMVLKFQSFVVKCMVTLPPQQTLPATCFADLWHRNAEFGTGMKVILIL